MTMHACPSCRCRETPRRPHRAAAPFFIDTSAPFWQLVVDIDRLMYPNYRGRPT